MAKELNLNVRMDATEMEALKRAAADDDRPISALVRRVLIVWLKEGGWFAATPGSRADPNKMQ